MCNLEKTSLVAVELDKDVIIERTTITCEIQFYSLTPKDEKSAEKSRAILVVLDAKTPTEGRYLKLKYRAVFSFDNENEIPEDNVFLEMHYREAYAKFKICAEKVLQVLDVPNLHFPDLDVGI